MQWFRFHAEALNDPKVQALDGETFKAWVNLLCMKCAGQDVTRDSTVTFALRVTVENWHVTRYALRSAGLLNEETGEINGWEKRQYLSDIKDPTAAERQRRYRQRKQKTVTTPLPLHSSDTDTEQNKIEKKDTSYPKKTLGKRLKVYLAEIGEDAAGLEFGTWAVEQLRLDVSTINAEMDKFCDYWNGVPGQKGVKLDWPATWRNWMRKVKEQKNKQERLDALWSKKR